MDIFSSRKFYARIIVVVLPTEFLSTLPTPGLSTPFTYTEVTIRLKTTGKNIVAGCVFQTPPLAPRTLLCVV